MIERSWLPCLAKMGATVKARIERRGFMPAGGGRVVVEIVPGPATPFEAMVRGEPVQTYAEALFSNLPVDIAQRELAIVGERLGLTDDERRIRQVNADGSGNAVSVTIECVEITEVMTAFGRRGVSAEKVAETVVKDVGVYRASGAAIGRHLADQLLVPMALLAGGRFTTQTPSRHTITNADVIRRFFGNVVQINKQAQIDKQTPVDKQVGDQKLTTITVAPTGGQGDAQCDT